MRTNTGVPAASMVRRRRSVDPVTPPLIRIIRQADDGPPEIPLERTKVDVGAADEERREDLQEPAPWRLALRVAGQRASCDVAARRGVQCQIERRGSGPISTTRSQPLRRRASRESVSSPCGSGSLARIWPSQPRRVDRPGRAGRGEFIQAMPGHHVWFDAARLEQDNQSVREGESRRRGAT